MSQTIAESIFERGIQQGIEQGIDRGIERGIEQGKRDLLLQMLQAKFGQVPNDLKDWINAIHEPAVFDSLAALVVRAEALDQVERYRKQGPARGTRRSCASSNA